MPCPSEANQPDIGTARPASGSSQSGGVVVRPARLEDAPRLALVNIETWRNAYAGLVPATYLDALDVESTRERWLARIAAPPRDRMCLVAEVDGVIAAYAIGGEYRTQQDAPAEEDTTGWGELYAIYTHPAFQGRRAGLAVHDALMGALAARGFTTAALWVLEDNVSAISWYGGRGWRADGAASSWLGAGEPLREIRLTCDLRGLAAPPASAPATRPARLDDAARLAVINVDSWQDIYAGILSAAFLDTFDVATMTKRWLDSLADPPGDEFVIVSELGGEVAAYARAGRYHIQPDAAAHDDVSGWGQLYALYTHPSLQRRGAGSLVHDAMMGAMAEAGYRTVALWVMRDSFTSMTWYADRGWRPDGGQTTWMASGQPLPEIRLVRDPSPNGSSGRPSSRLGRDTTGA